MLNFDDWGRQACAFFRSRRLTPFDEGGIVLENILRKRIETDQEEMRAFGSGVHKDSFLRAFEILDGVDVPYPMDILHLALEHFYEGDVEQIASVFGHWETGGKQRHQQNIVAYMEEVNGTIKELLRHYVLLPEQRERLQFMQKQPEAREVGDYINAWLVQKRIPATEQEITRQACLFGWAHVWNLVSRTETLSPANWEHLYYAVTTTMLTPSLYQDISLHSWELAELSYTHAPDPIRKLLGGLLYAKIIEVEGVQALKKPVVATLEKILATEDLFSSPSFVRFDPQKDAGYFVEDTQRSFVFKRTTQQEVDALSGIASIMINPTMTYYRVAARYSSSFSSQRGAPDIPRSYDEFHALLDEAKINPAFKKYFEIPCVKLGGLVLELPGDARVLSMHNEGKTLAEQLDAASDINVKMEMCRDALTMLSKFHLMITENLVHYEGKWYPSGGFHGYKGISPIPQITYRALLERRIVGTTAFPRFPRNAFLEDVLDQTDDLATFLVRGCVGAVVLDANDSNITEHGIIDVAKFSIANFFYDVACFLFGNSFSRKKDLDLHLLREHYISTLVGVVSETHIAHNDTQGGSFEEVCYEYRRWRTRDELLAAHKPAYEAMMRPTHPRASASFIEAQSSHTLLDLVMNWDCCQPSAAERMREYCQTAAIFVTMGETGSLLHQVSSAPPSQKEFLEQELQYAVANSLALMREQGFTDLAGKWRSYLALSRRIPDTLLGEDSLLSENMFIPNLAKRVVGAVYAPPRRFPVMLSSGLYM